VHESTSITRNKIISELSRSPHGKLEEYLPSGVAAAKQDSEFLAHLIGWDKINGQVRDSKVALPVIALMAPGLDPEFEQNALAHIAMLRPRELERAFRFALAQRVPGKMRTLYRLVRRYLEAKESDFEKWSKLALQHRKTLATLYAITHAKRSEIVGRILFEGFNPPGSAFEAVANLKTMAPAEAAGTILEMRIPFIVASGALGEKMKEPDLILALIKRMSPTELVTNAKRLKKLGVENHPALRGAFEAALERAAKSTKNVLKTTRAAESMEEDDEEDAFADKLRGLQEKQLQKLSGVEGDWIVLGDKSNSMQKSIEGARQVAATLAKMVKGKVTIIFFDVVPARVFDVTGKSYEEIKSDTRHVQADGGTSIGCGLRYAIDRKVMADGIAIVSDAQENTPPLFVNEFAEYCKMVGKEVPVYLYRYATAMRGYQDRDLAVTMKEAGRDLQEFDLRKEIDFYSFPNLVKTMRTNRYSLVDEVMNTKLFTVDEVLGNLRKEEPCLSN
jgi:hypothetical protein